MAASRAVAVQRAKEARPSARGMRSSGWSAVVRGGADEAAGGVVVEVGSGGDPFGEVAGPVELGDLGDVEAVEQRHLHRPQLPDPLLGFDQRALELVNSP